MNRFLLLSVEMFVFALLSTAATASAQSVNSARTKGSGIETQVVRSVPAIPQNRIRSRQVKPVAPMISRFTSVMTVGMDMRAERDQQQSTLPRAWPTIALGLGLRPWMALLEYSSFTERSGNQTLGVERKAETALIWGQWSAVEDWDFNPYFGFGLGGYRNSAELDLYGQKTGASGRWIEHAAGAVGLRWAKINPFYASIEGRVHMNRELDPNPTLSALIKVGFILE